MLGLRLINGLIPLFPTLAVLVLAPEYFLPVREFANDYHATLDGKNAMTAINNVLNEAEMKQESIDLKTWDENSRLSLEGVSVSYEGKTVLSADFSVKGLKKIGIIGMSGSGKSTLINTLSGFLQPTEGKIELGDQRVANFALEQWQKQMIYIPQDPYVFQLSLKDNLAFYTPEASEADILEAVRVAGLSELVAELPEGLETQLGSGARRLSGGQAQRIALARAFLDKKRKVLMFDEPTAHLDIETEVELKERMLPLMKDRLVFLQHTGCTGWLRWMKSLYLIKEKLLKLELLANYLLKRVIFIVCHNK